MRMVKKERVDVKKFMEEMKANRTNRSYTSIEPRNRQNSEEHQERSYASKYRPETIDHYRPTIPQQPLRYSFEQAPRYPPPYAPLPYPPADYAPSQHFTASPPFQQHSSMFNYSQTFNSQVYPPQHQQDSVRYEQNFGAEMTSAFYQPRGVGSKLATLNQPNLPERTNSLQEFTNPAVSASRPKIASPEPAKQKQSIEMPNRVSNSLESKEQVVVETKILPEPAKKQRKHKKKAVEKNAQKVPEPAEKELNVVEGEEMNTATISRKFEEILAVERKKIEAKAAQENILKEVMAIFKKRLVSITGKHFTVSVVEKLTNLRHQVGLTERIDVRDDVFEQEIVSFEAEILERIKGIN